MFECFENQWSVVGKEADATGDVIMTRQDVLDIGLSLGHIELVGEGRNHFEAVARNLLTWLVVAAGIPFTTEDLVDHTLAAQSCVVLFESADEDGHLAAVGQCFLDQFAAHPSRFIIVDSNETDPFGIGGIGVVGDQQRLLGDTIEEGSLIDRIDGADGDTVDTFDHQVLDDSLLIRQSIGGHVEGGIDPDLGCGILDTLACQDPEVGDSVGDECEPGRGIGVRWNHRPFEGICEVADQGQCDDDCDSISHGILL